MLCESFHEFMAERRSESCMTTDIFRLRGLRTLFSPLSKTEILGQRAVVEILEVEYRVRMPFVFFASS